MASRYWVGGTGTWDASDTTHWASVTGAAGGASVPTSVDDVVFDGASGGGIVTVNGDHTVLTFDCGSFSGTLDWSANNNNFTCRGLAQFSGTGARTIKLGSGTFLIDQLSLFTITNLTWIPGTALIKLVNNGTTPATLSVALAGGVTWPNIQIGPDTTFPVHVFSQAPVITNLNFAASAKARGTSITISATNLTASEYSKGKGAEIRGEGGTVNLALTNPGVLHWAALRGVNATSAAIRAYNSMSGGNNTNVQISPPKRGMIVGG